MRFPSSFLDFLSFRIHFVTRSLVQVDDQRPVILIVPCLNGPPIREATG